MVPNPQSICGGCVTASARKPPYLQTQVPCPGLEGPGLGSAQEQTLDNLCGDLNKGYLPVNPIGQNVLGVSYPFELIKNKTLDFFSKTLPILKADDTLPKVAKYQDSHIMYNPTIFNSQVNNIFYSDSKYFYPSSAPRSPTPGSSGTKTPARSATRPRTRRTRRRRVTPHVTRVTCHGSHGAGVTTGELRAMNYF